MGSKVEYVSMVTQPTSIITLGNELQIHIAPMQVGETYLVGGRTGIKPDEEVIVARARFSQS